MGRKAREPELRTFFVSIPIWSCVAESVRFTITFAPLVLWCYKTPEPFGQLWGGCEASTDKYIQMISIYRFEF